MRKIAIIILMALLSSCAIYNTKPPLDKEFTDNGRILAKNSELTLASSNEPYTKFVTEKLLKELGESFQNFSNQKLEIKEVINKYPHGGEGFQCFEPYLLVVSLGIIPSICEQETTIVVRLIDSVNGKSETKQLSYKTKSIAGWLSLFYAPNSEWSYKHASEKQALYTLVNEMAEKQK